MLASWPQKVSLNVVYSLQWGLEGTKEQLLISFTIIGKFENDELLTGTINKEAKLSLFYPIVFGIAGIFACVSALIICFTKIIEKKKRQKLGKEYYHND